MSASARLLPAPPAETAEAPPQKKKKKGLRSVTYRGLCITCGEKIVVTGEKMELAYFAFCDATCKARFDAEMNMEID